MAYVNVDTSDANYGNAPKGTQVGDVVHTAGGDFQVVPEGTEGANYNKASGLWSVKVNSEDNGIPIPNSGKTSTDFIDDGKTQQDDLNQQMSDAAALANAISAFSSAQSYAFNSEEAKKTRDWQEYMSNTAHQREVRDLIMAGLNPVLSAKLGGSSTPAGATASGQAYQGQKADVDTSIMPYMSNIIGSVLGYQSQMNVAKIQQETAMQTAAISSAASMYGADKSASAQMYNALKSLEGIKYSTDNGKNPSYNIGNDLYEAAKEYFEKNPDLFKFDKSAYEGKSTWEKIKTFFRRGFLE